MILLDDLEVTGELPIGDGLAGLALLPFTGRRVMLDESIPEQVARGPGAFQALGRLAEGARQGPLLRMLDRIGIALDGLARIDPSLPALVAGELEFLADHWPEGLPRSVIHADLFPDNVLMMGHEVSGLIDFYFACNDITAYDLAVTHAAWCFDNEGRGFRPEIGSALIAGYESVRPLSHDERAALPVLARGAAMRFMMTRAEDWLNTPADALVTRKDPLAFARRLAFYADRGASAFVAHP